MLRQTWFLAWAGALLLIGCAPRDEPFAPVSGKVTLDEKPLAEGKISFVTPGQPPEVLDVRDGTFKGRVKPGKKRVEIRAYRSAKARPKPGPGVSDAAVMENYLPPAYNTDSTLEADVAPTGPNEFSFSVKSR
jgi:hypothetical protein